jgi:glutamine amidotransferase
MSLAIIKYNAGNVQSVLYALQRLGVNAIVTDKHEDILAADKVIFPGVGNADSAMKYLKGTGLDELIVSLKQPVLGICLGLQLLCKSSEEGNIKCLDIFDAEVKKFDHANAHNQKAGNLSSPLMKGVNEESYVYYVHSYYAELTEQTIATTDYILPYSAAIQKNNFYGVQFHTEKSAEAGEKILSNFLKII